jgi:hypothetical protein
MPRQVNLARVDRRPEPANWGDDDDMTLAEYIAVFWPEGPLTINTLRTAIKRGDLTAAWVRGLWFVTPAQVRALFQPKARTPCHAAPKAPASTFAPPAQGAGPTPSGSSVTDRLKSAQAALNTSAAGLMAQSRRSPPTSPPSGRRRPNAQVIRPAFTSPKS